MNQHESGRGMTAVQEQTPGGMDAEDLEALRESVRGVCSRRWPSADRAGDGDLGALWSAAAQQGWTGLGRDGLLSAAVAVQEELGRLACPVPVVDTALVAMLLTRRGDDLDVDAVERGDLRPVIVHGTRPASPETVLRHVEAAAAITHVLVVDEVDAVLTWYDIGSAVVEPTPGLPIPGWTEIRTSRSPAWSVPLADHADLVMLHRLGLGARAAAAVGRTHELAVEHAGRRRQFGALVGSFQAVSHRLVGVETALTAARQLLAHALQLHGADDARWPLAAEIFLEHVESHLAGLQFDGHHTLAAVGYFEEHEAPWLTRRVHADLAVLAASWRPASVGQLVLDGGARLPAFDLGSSAERIRDAVLDAFQPWTGGPPSGLHTWDDEARAVLRDRGWIGVGWPREMGGGGYDLAEMAAFSEAIAYASPPVGNIWMAVNSIVPMLIAAGPEPLREMVVEQARRGDLSIALGYSEPEAGSDLASLRTVARRVPGGWRVTGQKLWGTCVPDSQLIVLAARTDQAAARPQAGISLFLVDLDSPGITVHEHRSLGGDVSATTFWDDVFIPDDRLVGRENDGWAALGAALSGERVLIGAGVMKTHRAFDLLVDLVREDRSRVVSSRRPAAEIEIGRLAVRLQAARALVNAAVRAVASGGGGAIEAPMAKLSATEVAEVVHAAAITLLGPAALHAFGTRGAIGDGHFEEGLRSSIMGVIAGGTGDIQRNLVARGMGLPR